MVFGSSGPASQSAAMVRSVHVRQGESLILAVGVLWCAVLSLWQIIWEQLKWLPTTIIFFNSVLFHMTEVCAIYFLGLPVVWGATAKVRTGRQ
jgi:hypothetical protein